MAKFNSFVLGQASNSVGNVTMCRCNGMNIARGKTLKVRNPRTVKQVETRSKWKAFMRLAEILTDPLMAGHPHLKMTKVWRLFMHQNFSFASINDQMEVSIVYDKLRLSSGSLQKPCLRVEKQDSERKLTFTKKSQLEGRVSKLDDKVLNVLYETVRNEVLISDLGDRSVLTPVEIALPDEWEWANVKAYAFAVSSDASKASETLNLTL